ncbi:PRA1 family protein F3-like [Tasmannia lanceolata]|uniref:PRA1 family protein F3-like n=1 Tax=Tasmannia lanceolata TaxID=3420 RepID=UPI004064A2CE
MTTTYGAIPTAQPGTKSSLDFISTAKSKATSALSTCRPWKEMIHLHALSIPPSFPESIQRLRSNSAYFRMNYAIIVLLIVFISLLWHPISLIVFIIMIAAWLFLYFLRDDPIVIFHRTIDDRIVLAVLSVVTIVALLLTRATLNIIISVLVGLVLVFLHAVFRKTEDLFSDEEARGAYSVVGDQPSSSS